MPPKIVHVTTVPSTLRFLTGQVEFMKSRGAEIRLVSSPNQRDIDALPIDTKQFPVFQIQMERRITPIKDLKTLFQMVRYLRREQPDIVHAHTPKGGLLGTIAAWIARVPHRIYHIRGLPFVTATGNRRRLLTTTERISCLLANRVLSVSNSVREIAINEGLCSANKIHVIGQGSGNGVDAAQRFCPQKLPPVTRATKRAELGIPEDATVIGFVGRLVADKGVCELAAAWKQLRSRHSNIHLLVVGFRESETPLPDGTLESLDNDPRVHLAGRSMETPPFYAAMDLLVLPTYREGFPNVLLEAAAMELPVVATEVSGCVDAVIEGETGLLVPAQSAPQLAQAIESYLENPFLQRKHGIQARRRVLRDFRPELIWQGLWHEYLALMGIEQPAIPSTEQAEGRAS